MAPVPKCHELSLKICFYGQFLRRTVPENRHITRGGSYKEPHVQIVIFPYAVHYAKRSVERGYQSPLEMFFSSSVKRKIKLLLNSSTGFDTCEVTCLLF